MRYYYDQYNSLILEFNYPQDQLCMQFPKEDTPFTVSKEYKGGKTATTQYIRVNLSLDIETTTVFMFSVPYIISISLHKPHTNIFYVYHLRNWEDTQKLLDEIAAHYKLGHNKKTRTKRVMLSLVHNLSFEFYFCRHELDFDFDNWGFFAKEKRKCMKATLKNGIEFRDSLALTNCSLQQLSKMYTLHKKKKDLDYAKIRNTMTPLFEHEYRYINEDVIILNEFEDFFFDNFCMFGERPPLTNTARLLLRVKKAMNAAQFDQNKVALIQPSVVQIMWEQRYLFRGGYVHGNVKYIDQELKVHMRDITSSYPYSMLASYYPVSEWKRVKLSQSSWAYGKEPADFIELLNTKCIKFNAIYYNLQATTDHSYESRSKVIDFLPLEKDPVHGLDNGRIRRAEIVKVAQTEFDYHIYSMLYKYDFCEITDIQVSDRGKLPDFLLQCLIEDYKAKNDLKSAGLSDTPEYQLKKVDVNSYFGMLVKSVFQNNVGYSGGDWIDTTQALSEIQKEVNERFLSYDWGIWVCAASRFKLVDMLVRIELAGGHVVYYDTDSLKYIPDEHGYCDQIFELENKRIRELNKQNPLLQDPCFYGKLGRGIGEWDDELSNKLYSKPLPVLFKTLGSKRYMYYRSASDFKWNEKTCSWEQSEVGWHLCVAGLPKVAVDLLPDDPMQFFSIYGFSFEGEDTGKLRPVFHDEPYTIEVTDDEGNSEWITAQSGITLVPVDFDITDKKLYTLYEQVQAYKDGRIGDITV